MRQLARRIWGYEMELRYWQHVRPRGYALLVRGTRLLLSLLSGRTTKVHLFVFVDKLPALTQLRHVLLVHEVFGPRRLLLCTLIS